MCYPFCMFLDLVLLRIFASISMKKISPDLEKLQTFSLLHVSEVSQWISDNVCELQQHLGPYLDFLRVVCLLLLFCLLNLAHIFLMAIPDLKQLREEIFRNVVSTQVSLRSAEIILAIPPTCLCVSPCCYSIHIFLSTVRLELCYTTSCIMKELYNRNTLQFIPSQPLFYSYIFTSIYVMNITIHCYYFCFKELSFKEYRNEKNVLYLPFLALFA